MSLLILLILLVLGSNYPSSAMSLVLRDSLQPYVSDPSHSHPISACSNQRSIYDILWSCFATIFACCWVSIHPNIPSSSNANWRITLRRMELLVWGLVAPELVILWAIRQWYGARYLANRYKGMQMFFVGILDYKWTKMHGHFLQMGGFRLMNSDGQKDLGILDANQFASLLAANLIKFPSITENEIQDRSKGDSLSKGLVIMQSTWFIIQCITRFVQGLVITEIELITLALATLNGVMYFLWWDKPLDVRSPVSIYMRTERPNLWSNTMVFAAPQSLNPTSIYSFTSFSETSMHNAINSDYLTSSVLSPPEAAFTLESHHNYNSWPPSIYPRSPMSVDTTREFSELPVQIYNEAPLLDPYTLSLQEITTQTPVQSNGVYTTSIAPKSPPNCETTQLKSILGNICKKIADMLITFFFFVFIYFPFLVAEGVARGVIQLLHRLKELSNHHDINFKFMGEMTSTCSRVPTFYSTNIPTHETLETALQRSTMNGIAATIGALFGAIHCAGWNFPFLSRSERILWHISSVLIVGGPTIVAFFYLISSWFIIVCNPQQHDFSGHPSIFLKIWPNLMGSGFMVVVFMVLMYIVARLCLLILALIALRNLPTGAYAVVEWASLIPHI